MNLSHMHHMCIVLHHLQGKEPIYNFFWRHDSRPLPMRGPVMGLECKDRRTRALRHIIKHNPVLTPDSVTPSLRLPQLIHAFNAKCAA